ncbi:hypothetical protein EYF80_064281 [Liparis tanakae]|uniref:Uncharacterized protein n=1 Tax=Liparis tanakae TaxID=230148 RepID=A0A4Z2E9V3_9TELE|nr:hypothetical protein EYF80_064281 [Liparis tanakae]
MAFLYSACVGLLTFIKESSSCGVFEDSPDNRNFSLVKMSSAALYCSGSNTPSASQLLPVQRHDVSVFRATGFVYEEEDEDEEEEDELHWTGFKAD